MVWTQSPLQNYVNINRFTLLRGGLLVGLFAAPLVSRPSLAADSIVVINPSFQADTFPTFPGYVSSGENPFEITGWTGTGGHGVNGADMNSGVPFADNGIFPDNTRVAFIQGAGSLSQTLSGFEVGERYWVQGFANARACCGDIPTINVSLGSSVLLPDTPLTPVGAGNPYNFVNLVWIADSPDAALTISSRATSGGDASVAIDGISIIKRSANDVVIANPSFEASGNSFGFPGYIPAPYGPAGWTRSGGSGQIVINGSNASGNPFADNGLVPEGNNVLGLQQDISVTQTLSDLVIGRPYRLTLDYNSRSGDDPTALITINSEIVFSGTVPEVGGSEPYYHLSYDFVATATTTSLSIANLGLAGDSTLLVDNVRVLSVPEPSVLSCALLGLAALTGRLRRQSRGIA